LCKKLRSNSKTNIFISLFKKKMTNFLRRQASKENKEREYYANVLGIRTERPAPYPRESPRRRTPTRQSATADDPRANIIDLTDTILEEGEAAGASQGDTSQAPQVEITENPDIGRSSPQKRRREDDDVDGTF
jgi:hypothetical protein